ncbi:hypothetical protein [Streptomyces sp. NPDC048111]
MRSSLFPVSHDVQAAIILVPVPLNPIPLPMAATDADVLIPST